MTNEEKAKVKEAFEALFNELVETTPEAYKKLEVCFNLSVETETIDDKPYECRGSKVVNGSESFTFFSRDKPLGSLPANPR